MPACRSMVLAAFTAALLVAAWGPLASEARADRPALVCPPGTTVKVEQRLGRTESCARADGTKHGPFRDASRQGSYVDGKLDGPFANRIGPSLALGQYRQGKEFGKWEMWIQGELLSEDNYDESGLLQGDHVEFHRGGGVCDVVRMERGTGVVRMTDSRNCAVEQVTGYRDGREHGWSWKFDEGLAEEITHYAEGRRHGLQLKLTRDKLSDAVTTVLTTCFVKGREVWREKDDTPSRRACESHKADMQAVLGFSYGEHGLPNRVGLVLWGSGASAAGLMLADVIVAVDGRAVGGLEKATLAKVLDASKGAITRLRVARGGRTVELQVVRKPLDVELAQKWLSANKRLMPLKPGPRAGFKTQKLDMRPLPLASLLPPP